MKLFHKQLTLLFIFFGLVFGLAAFFFFTGVNRIITGMAAPSAQVLANRLKQETSAVLTAGGFKSGWSDDLEKPLRTYFIEQDADLGAVDEFWIVASDSQVVFSRKTFFGNAAAQAILAKKIPGKNAVQKVDGSNHYAAAWTLNQGSTLKAIVLINAHFYISAALHETTIKLYLIGFAGILGIIFVAMAATRVLKSPLRLVDNAMANIDKRKYGYRIKRKRGDEFQDTYNQVNIALTRLEQLDSVQRTAVERRNSLARELKTISRFMDIMAHEVKNPLHALVINIDVLRTKMIRSKAKADSIKHLNIIEKELEHLNEVITGFLNYVRPGVPQKERTGLNEIVKEVSQMVLAEAEKEGIKVELRLGKGLEDVSIDRGQVQQALLNILVNAMHASSEASRIAIRTWAKGKKNFISVRDEGVGISKEEQKRIFDLYFTTKKKGSGIGLPVTKRMVEGNGGQMQLESKVGKGTTVTLGFNSI